VNLKNKWKKIKQKICIESLIKARLISITSYEKKFIIFKSNMAAVNKIFCVMGCRYKVVGKINNNANNHGLLIEIE